MPEFNRTLADAVGDAAAHGRMPAAADIIHRGHRRALRQRTGVGVLGVAALSGAIGLTTLGGGSHPGSSVGPGAGSTPTAPAAVAPSPHGAGFLPADQWPRYDLVDWKVSVSKDEEQNEKLGSLNPPCGSGMTPSIAQTVAAHSQASDMNEPHRVNGFEYVWTFGDEADARAIVQDAQAAAHREPCPPYPHYTDARTVPGASTDYGVSWVVNNPADGSEPSSVVHQYLVQYGAKVAFLTIDQHVDADFAGVADDMATLQNMLAALKK